MFRYFHRKTKTDLQIRACFTEIKIHWENCTRCVFCQFLNLSLFNSVNKRTEANSDLFMTSLKHYSSIYYHMPTNFLFRLLMCIFGENEKLKCPI